ncbi:hypothetical protein CONLIGDRAFT_679342 [Coniochaeta ligniaria NRRL 30616]|uniref:Uncharacterized protein n=1 Tax=Coniochaeta ligniaria NRRL 30616 TaxID=1408157 RepID=A0A1J7JB96_9PEZI|nr:hypothetical protein CONLIGDRAFT_679342 [Coniochaeta ligniaria NRRL 30616]
MSIPPSPTVRALADVMASPMNVKCITNLERGMRIGEILTGKRPRSHLITLDDEFSPSSGQLWEFGVRSQESRTTVFPFDKHPKSTASFAFACKPPQRWHLKRPVPAPARALRALRQLRDDPEFKAEGDDWGGMMEGG